MITSIVILLISTTIKINALMDVEVEFEPYVFTYQSDHRFFYFPGDGDNKVYLIDSSEEQLYRSTGLYNPNTYWLYTRKNMNKSQELIIDDIDRVNNSNFDVLKDTVFIVHGWKGNCNNTISELLTSVFLGDGDVNVIVVDYSEEAEKMYIMAMLAANEVGQDLGRFIKFLTTLGMSYEKTHLVGFSLGAHVVGLAGRFTNGRIRRITALDPAGPMWYNNENRIRNTDANYVEVIHTNMLLFGFDGKLGDADFYPNGGIFMPECVENVCSHSIAYYYMAQTVKFNNLIANECYTTNEVGIDLCSGSEYPMGNSDLNKNRTGMFRVDTATTRRLYNDIQKKLLKD